MQIQSSELSVVLCTHNGQKFIRQQLDSILGQTLLPSEIVISDDASTDGTLDFVLEYWQTRKIQNISLVTLRNEFALGVSSNFHQAIAASSGSLIALCDQDDIWHEQKLELLSFQFLEQKDTFLVNSNAELIDENNRTLKFNLFESLKVRSKELEQIKSGEAIKVFLKRNLVTGATVLFDRRLFQIASPFPAQFLHDEWLAIVAASCNLKIITIPEKLIQYRQHSNNVVGIKRLGFKHYVGRTIFPRTERNQILLNRAKVLLEFTDKNMNAASNARYLISEYYAFEKARSNYPSNRFARIGPIYNQAKKLNYKQFGIGFLDIIRDFIQPQ